MSLGVWLILVLRLSGRQAGRQAGGLEQCCFGAVGTDSGRRCSWGVRCAPAPVHPPHPPTPTSYAANLLCCLPQVVIHPAIQPKDANAMTQEAHAAIASSLPPELVAPPEEEVGSSVDSS